MSEASPITKPRRKRVRDGIELIKMSELSRRSGVTAPTLKHFMREGLLPEPELRTSRNMAYYDARLVDRITVIRKLQSERFLPLKVIGDLLEPAPSANIRTDVDASSRQLLGDLAPTVAQMTQPVGNWTARTEIVRQWNITAAELDQLEAEGHIKSHLAADGAMYTGVDLQLLELLAEVRRLGLGAHFPIEMVGPYISAVRLLCTAEVDMFRRRVIESGLTSPLPLHEMMQHAVRIGEKVIVLLRGRLLQEALTGQRAN